MKGYPLGLLKKSKDLGTRYKEFIEKELALIELTEEQNIRFEKLRQGYKALGLLDEYQDKQFGLITGKNIIRNYLFFLNAMK